MPRLESPGALLAFLWVSRLAQAQRGEARCASAAVIWAEPAARASFEAFGGGKAGLDSGLARCLELRALIAIRLRGAGVDEAVSKVLKRSPQCSHPRRRRMVAPSSDTRESITRVSSCWQKGQCI